MKLYEKSYNLAANMQKASLQCRLPATLGVCCFNFEVKLHLIIYRQRRQYVCKYFSQTKLLHNHLAINVLQNLLFCVPKAAVLHGKSVGFATQNSRFRNAKSKLPIFNEIIFTKQRLFLAKTTVYT